MPIKKFVVEYFCKNGREDVVHVHVVNAGNPNAAAMKLLVEEGNHDRFEKDEESSYDDVLVLSDMTDRNIRVRVSPYKMIDNIAYIGTYDT